MAPAKRKRKSGRKKLIRILITTAVILLLTILIKGIDVYSKVLRSNVVISSGHTGYFYIPTGSDFESVCADLLKQGIVKDINTFIWVAEKKNYVRRINPGKYRIRNGMNNNELVNLLRSGNQEAVRLSFRNIRTASELAGKISGQLEADSMEFMNYINDGQFTAQFGFNRNNIISLFIPNTYELYWNTSAEEFIRRMAKEYNAFWNESRLAKARRMGLSQTEVTTLASIVQAEQTIRPDERPVVAGVYINRLRKGMRLESDPTVIFAMNNFTVKRVLNKDRRIDSPYNTYKNKGLPPGPINIPEINSIEAVLNYQHHDYLFMCAKEDFSGYHNFSRTNSEHNVYARLYRSELNKKKIYR